MSLIAKNVYKTLGDTPVLKDVAMALEPGQIHALVGENGAGKTTLMRILAGVYAPDKGSAQWEDAPIFNNPSAKAQIAFVPAQCELFPAMNKQQLAAFFKSVYPAFDTVLFEALTKPFERKRVRDLSTGMKMLLSVSAAICRHPRVLILDEPFAGLDVIVKRRVMDLIVENSEAAVLISSHNLSDLERIADSVTFLIKGRVTASGDVFAVKAATFKRLQVVFEGKVPADLLAFEGVTNMEMVGRVVTLTYEGDDEKMESRLRSEGVLLLERLGATLEESFIHGYEDVLKKGGN